MGSPVHLRGRGFRVFAAVLIVGALLPSAACGNDTSACQAPSSSGTQSQTPSPSQPTPKIALPKQNSRGNIVKHVGEKAAMYDNATDMNKLASWTVTKIVTDPPCTTQFGTHPEAGHFVEFDVNVVTSSKFNSQYGPLLLGEPHTWKYIQKNGTQWNGMPASTSSDNCMPKTELLPMNIGQGVKASGKILFDLPSTDGYLVYDGGSSNGGWEYPLSTDPTA